MIIKKKEMTLNELQKVIIENVFIEGNLVIGPVRPNQRVSISNEITWAGRGKIFDLVSLKIVDLFLNDNYEIISVDLPSSLINNHNKNTVESFLRLIGTKIIPCDEELQSWSKELRI